MTRGISSQPTQPSAWGLTFHRLTLVLHHDLLLQYEKTWGNTLKLIDESQQTLIPFLPFKISLQRLHLSPEWFPRTISTFSEMIRVATAVHSLHCRVHHARKRLQGQQTSDQHFSAPCLYFSAFPSKKHSHHPLPSFGFLVFNRGADTASCVHVDWHTLGAKISLSRVWWCLGSFRWNF